MKNVKCITIILSFLLIKLTNISCSNNIEENENIDVVSNYSTSEVFDGIVLAKGILANQLPTLDPKFTNKIYADLTKQELNSLEEFKNYVFDKLNEKNPSILVDFTENIHSNDPYVIENAIKIFYKEYLSVLVKMPELNKALNQTEYFEYYPSTKDSILTKFKARNKNQINGSTKNDEQYFEDQEGFTSVAPVICLTLIVWNVGVAVNVAAAVNAAVGVNVAFAVNVAVGVNLAVSGTSSGSGGGRNNPDDINEEHIPDNGEPKAKSFNSDLLRELEFNDISVSENLVQEIIEATHN